MKGRETLAKDDYPESNRNQRIDEVPERRLNDVAARHCPDIDSPVDGEKAGSDRRHESRAPSCVAEPECRPVVPNGDYEEKNWYGPDDSMEEEGRCIGRYKVPENRRQAPENVRCDPIPDAAPMLHRFTVGDAPVVSLLR